MKRITVTVVQLLLSLLVNVEVSHANITRKEPMTMANDFDFEIGSWVVEHRKLKDFFNGKDEWIAFTGISSTRKILGGQGNLEENLIEMPDGTFSAVAIRTYEQKTGLWHIWWLDGRVPGSIDKPVVGKFESGLGTFFAEDVINGHEVKVRFIWDAVVNI